MSAVCASIQALKWDLTPLTVVSWINIFLQTVAVDGKNDRSQFMIPQYSQHVFVQVMRVRVLRDNYTAFVRWTQQNGRCLRTSCIAESVLMPHVLHICLNRVDECVTLKSYYYHYYY